MFLEEITVVRLITRIADSNSLGADACGKMYSQRSG